MPVYLYNSVLREMDGWMDVVGCMSGWVDGCVRGGARWTDAFGLRRRGAG